MACILHDAGNDAGVEGGVSTERISANESVPIPSTEESTLQRAVLPSCLLRLGRTGTHRSDGVLKRSDSQSLRRRIQESRMRENRTYGLTRGLRPKVRQVLRREPTERVGGKTEESGLDREVLARTDVKNTRQP